MNEMEKRMEIRRKEYQEDKITYKWKGIWPMVLILSILIIIAAVAGMYGFIQLIVWLLYITFFYPLHMLVSLTITALSVYIIYRIRIRLPKNLFVYLRNINK
tara:strand:- start:1436 stop:1741 length:306 start_codon:yes stop_codon:yes gene_type:complete